jgi:hypothetical protein
MSPGDRTRQPHLVGVWNPSYAADAMDAHLRLLLANIAGFRANPIAEEDKYVWILHRNGSNDRSS